MTHDENENRATQTPLATLTPEQLSQLEAALQKESLSLALAARLMGRLGLRVGEVQKLSWAHVEITATDEPVLHITSTITKTGYARDLPINPAMAELLLQRRAQAKIEWEERETGAKEVEDIKPFMSYPVVGLLEGDRPTVRWYQLRIGRTAKRVLGHKIKPHTLRHTFATRLLQETNIRVVQQALGHRSLRSTQVYTHPTMRELRDAINKTEE